MAQSRPDGGGSRMRVGKSAKAFDGAFARPRVGVEDQDVVACGLADAAVPTGAEPEVLLLDDAHAGKALAHELDRPVARAVVDDDDVVADNRLERPFDPR